MPPFNLPMVLGTDIAQISRFRNPNPNWVVKLSRRILTQGETVNLAKRFPPWHQFIFPVKEKPVDPRLGAQEYSELPFLRWLAARWAAKEAARKAWGTNLLGFRDVGVVHGEDGKPSIRLLPVNRPKSKGENLAQFGCLSISHDGDYAVATVIAAPMDSKIEKILQLTADGHSVFSQEATELDNNKADLEKEKSGVITNREGAYKRLSNIVRVSKKPIPETTDENKQD